MNTRHVLLEHARAHARLTFNGTRVFSPFSGARGIVIDVEISEEILDAREGAFDFVTCWIWSGKKLWQARASSIALLPYSPPQAALS